VSHSDPPRGELIGRVAVVTGGSHNIGFGIATRLVQAGAAVVLFDKNAEATDAAAHQLAEHGGEVRRAVGDVADSRDVEAAMRVARSSLGAVDILVNNAGIWIVKTLLDHTEEDFDRVVGTNLKGTFLCCRAVLPSMIERGWGRIVNIASIAAFHYTVPHVSYAASKAGIVALTRDLAYEVASHGVTVNAIAPGSIPPDGGPVRSARRLPMGPGTPTDIAEAVAFLASDRAHYISGVTVPVAGAADIALPRDEGDSGHIWQGHRPAG
jgi:NAD(P)-dependent dehydrogenase (short-subunit alcohol dehydrogenase family)